MGAFLYLLIPVAIGVVAVILGLGVYTMGRGGSPYRSQKLMQWRVLAQAVALIIIFGALYFSGR